MKSAVLVVVVALCSCADAGGREKLTVLVEADRARALEDQARLADMQASLDDAKRDLVALRKRLLEAGALTADESRRLEEHEAKLGTTAGLVAPSPSPSPSSSLSKADVEELLKASEDRIRASCSSSPSTPSTPAPPAGATPDDVAVELAAADQALAERGLLPDDVPEHERLQQRIAADLKAHRNGDALAGARELVAAISRVNVDGALIEKKFERAQSALGNLPSDRKADVQRLMTEASALRGHGKLSEANAKLNAALQRVWHP
jgi:hypothetical protein